MSKIKRSKEKTAVPVEKLGPMKVVRHKAADRKRLPADLEAFANSDEKRIRRPKPSKQLDDPRMVYLVTGVANRHARLVYDAHLTKIEAALAEHRDSDEGNAALAKALAKAVALGVWRGKSLTSFAAFVEGVLAMDEAEATALAVEGGADDALTRLSDTVIAVWMRIEAALAEEGYEGEVSVSKNGKKISVELDLEKAPEAFAAISRLVSPMSEPAAAEYTPRTFGKKAAPVVDVDDDAEELVVAKVDGAEDETAVEGADAFSVETNDESDEPATAWGKRDVPSRVKDESAAKLDDNAWTPPARKPARDFGDAPRGPRKDFGDKPRGPRRDFGDAPRGPRRDFGDAPRGPRKDFGDKPRGPRPAFGGGDAPRGPRRDFGDAPRGPRRDFGAGGDAPRGPRRDFGDAPRGPRRDFGGGGDAPRGPRRDFGGGGDAPRGPRRDFGGGGDAPRGPRRDFGGGGDAPRGPRRDFGGGGDAPRGPRRDFGGGGDAPRGPRRDFGDAPRGPRRDFGDKPRGPRPAFGDKRPAFGDKPRGPRPAFGDKRPAFGDKPRGPRADFGDKPRGPRRDFGGPSRGPRPDFGDKPRGPRRDDGGGPRKPRGPKR